MGDLTLDAAGFATVTGTVGLINEVRGDDEFLYIAGQNVNASVGNDSVGVSLSSADFGLLAGDAGLAFELKNGEFNANLANFAGVSADETMIRYTDDTTTVEANTEINVGQLSYRFEDDIEANMALLEAKGFAAQVAGFVSLTGDLGVSYQNDDLIMVGSSVTARLGTDDVHVQMADADFGLLSDDEGTSFELTNGQMSSQLGDLGNFGAGRMSVQYSTDGHSMDQGDVLIVGGTRYEIQSDIENEQVAAVAIEEFEIDAAGFVTLSGDLALKKTGEKLIGVGNNVSARVGTESVGVSLTGADFGLSIEGDQTVFAMDNGAFAANLGDVASVRADEVFVEYASATALWTRVKPCPSVMSAIRLKTTWSVAAPPLAWSVWPWKWRASLP